MVTRWMFLWNAVAAIRNGISLLIDLLVKQFALTVTTIRCVKYKLGEAILNGSIKMMKKVQSNSLINNNNRALRGALRKI